MTKEQVSSKSEPEKNPVLLNAWTRFAEYDLSANKHQKKFLQLRITILSLGVLATIAALSYAVFGPDDIATADWWYKLWRYVVILLPISTSVLLAGAIKLVAEHNSVVRNTTVE